MVVFAGPPRCLQNRVFYNGFCYFTFPFFDPSRLFSCGADLVFCCCTRFAWEVSTFAKSHLHFLLYFTGWAVLVVRSLSSIFRFFIFVFSPLSSICCFFVFRRGGLRFFSLRFQPLSSLFRFFFFVFRPLSSLFRFFFFLRFKRAPPLGPAENLIFYIFKRRLFIIVFFGRSGARFYVIFQGLSNSQNGW